jgi:diguanylate cyclase (GGDEF)-like protein
MNPVRSIKSLLLVAGFVFSLVMVVVTGLIVSRIYEKSVREDAAQSADSFAALTFNAMFELMSTGWNRQQLEGYLGAIQKSVDDTPRRIDIYRGPRVSALFGEVAQKPFDVAVARGFAEGLPVREDIGDVVRVIRPLAATEVCRACHTNAAVGDVLGVIDVQVDVGRQIAVHRERFLFALAPIVPLALIATLLMVSYIQRRLATSLAGLADDIGTVNKVADLRVLESRTGRFGFAEFNLIQHEIGQLTERIRSIAVDKEMLEFEIRLLEKFVLTSEVVKDWREYVKRLMVEIDTIMPAYAMFSIFKTGEGSYDLEVFWRYSPTEQTKRCFEGCMRAVLPATPYFTSGCAVRVAHNVADRSVELPELSMADIEVKVKSLLVDIPKIGGIVGIGMQPQDAQEPSRLLAVQSILATLLNVVGSVKAIDKYTKELEYHATRDPLTNLYNQRVFWELIDSEVNRSARQGNKFSILVIDADNFKSVNDSYGHGVGDLFLQKMADGIRQAIRDDDLLSRYGGDEFVAILPDSDQATAHRVARRIIYALSEVCMLGPDGARITTSVSVGMSTYPDHALSSRNLFLFADNMMYRAKAEGKNRVIVPTAEDVIEVFRTLGEKSMLVLDAIERRAVVPFYQSILNAQTGEVEAVEVLSRIRLEDGSYMAADHYVEIAEKMGVMHRLDFIQLEKALTAVEECGYAGYLFINLSPRALVLHDFMDETRRIVSRF